MILGKTIKCFYCGSDADSLDHVIPWSFYSNKRRKNAGKAPGFRVGACRECNGLLGSSFYPSMFDRCKSVNSKLRAKYKKLFKTPEWDEEELQEVSAKLRQSIRATLTKKREISKRLEFQNTKDFFDHYQLCVDELLGANDTFVKFFVKDTHLEIR